MVLALILGLVVGGGVAGGLWLGGVFAGPKPAPVVVGLQSFPASLLGLQRQDLAGSSPDMQALAAQGNVDQIEKAYGASGFQISYTGEQQLRVLAVNAGIPLPVVYPDSQILQLRVLSAPMAIAAPSTATVSCVVTPTSAQPVDSAEKLPAVKSDVLAGTDGVITCRRTDPARPFSLQMVSIGKSDMSLRDRAAQLATAIDSLWQGVVR